MFPVGPMASPAFPVRMVILLSVKFYIQDVVRVVSDVYYLCSFDGLAEVLLFMN